MATYTPEEYAAAAAFIQANIDNPQYIAEVVSSLGVSLQDLTSAVQTVAPDVTVNDVSQYFESNNVDTSVFATPERFTQDQYEQAGQWIAQNIDNQDLVKQTVQQLGLTDAEVTKAAQTVNPEITTKEVTNYLSVPSQQEVNNAVITAIQNGFTVDELKDIAKTLNIPEEKVNSAFETVVGSKASADIIKDISAMIPAGQSITFDKIVKYADDNKLPYATVGEALKSTFQNTTADQIVESMVYEKDRQQFNNLAKDVTVDGKTVKQVNLGEAIAASIQQSIDPKNLAKFYGKTESEFKSLVENNLQDIAVQLRTAGVNPETGLNSLLGFTAKETSSALNAYDKDVLIRSELAKKQSNGLTLNEILDEIDSSGMSIQDFVTKYFGKDNASLVTNLTKESKYTPQERQWREAASGLTNLTPQQVVDFQAEAKLSDADMDRIFGIKSTDLNTYRTQVRDAFITTGLNQLQANDNKLDYSEILSFAKQNNIPFTEMAKYIATPEKQEEAVKTLQNVSATQALRESLIGTQVSDYQGNKYDATQLLNLADQVKQNFDLKSSSGGVYQTEGQSVGFNYDEASKLFPEGKSPNVVDQVALDVARNLMSRGITDLDALKAPGRTEGGYGRMGYAYYYPPGTPGLENVRKMEGGPFKGWHVLPGDRIGIPLGGTGTGNEFTDYYLNPNKTEGAVFTKGSSSSDMDMIAPVIAFAAAIAAPYLLPEIIGTTVGGVELAALGGEMVAGTGLTGHLMAAGVSSSVAPYAASVLVNGTVQGLMAEAGGGSFEKGFITGGVAPVIGQLATNAVNTALGDLNLPSGVDKAVGNAVTQLIATGEIDPTQMLVAGASPTISKAIQEETGLNAAQTKLLLNTIASEGKNLQALLDPAKAITFINQNKGIFDNIGLDAASGASPITSGQPVDFGAFNEKQVAQLQGRDTVTSSISKDTVSGIGQDTVSPVLPDTIPAATGLDTAPGITGTPPTDEFAGFDAAVKYANDLTAYKDALKTGSLDFQGYDQARLEATLIDMQPTLERARDAAETLYGKGASFTFDGKFYEGDLGKTVLTDAKGNQYTISKEATLITNSQGGVTGYTLNGKTYDYKGNEIKATPPVVGVEVPGSTEVPQARLPTGVYTRQGFIAAGGGKTESDYDNYRTVANDLVAKGYNASGISPLGFNSASALADDMSTRAGIVRTSAAYTQPTQAPLSSYTAAGSPYLAGFGHLAMAVGGAGATIVEASLRGLNQTEAANRVAQASQDAFFAARNIAATSPDVEKTLAVSSGVLSGVSLLLSGGTAWASAIPSTIVAMNETFRDGQIRGLSDRDNLTRTLGAGAAEYVGDVIGNKVLLGAVKGIPTGNAVAVRESLIDGYSKLPANPTAQQIKDMVGAWAKINGVDQFSEGVTTALQMANDKAHGITENIPQNAAELQKLVTSQMETVFGATNIALGIGGGAYVASRSANLGQITIEYADEISKGPVNKTLQDILDVTPVTQTVALLTGPDNKTVLNSQGQPILIQSVVNQPSATVVSGAKDVIPNDFSASLPTESVFDIIFDNEKNGGYTVNAVNLDGNEYTVTDGTGKVQVIDTNDLFNNALNLVTQTDPAAIQALKESNPLVGYLTEQVAKNVNINAVNGALQTGSVISSNDKGAFAITNDGAIAFIPKTNTSGANGVAMSDFQGGDSVVIGNGYAAPAMKQVDADGNVQVKVDELKVDPLSGFGRVIGLDNSQALVALPNQELLTINRANLSPDITVGATVPYNQSTVTQRGVTTDYAQSTFGLTQTQLLQGLTIPSVSQLPVFVNVVDPSGVNKIIDAAKPNIGSGTVISVDPNTGTALVSAGAGNPQVVNLQGMNPNIGTDIFFNPGTSAVIGTPVITKPETQTKPSGIVSLIPPVYTPIGLQPPSITPITTPPVELAPPVVSPPVITTITPPAEIEVPTITPPVVTPPPITIPPVELTPPVVTPPGVTTPPIVSPPPVVTPPVVTPPVVTNPPIVIPPIIPPSIGEPPPFGYPSVPPPELSGTYELPYPNYLRPLEPYLGYGIGALMGDLYDEKQGYGGYQPSQNAGSQIKIPT